MVPRVKILLLDFGQLFLDFRLALHRKCQGDEFAALLAVNTLRWSRYGFIGVFEHSGWYCRE